VTIEILSMVKRAHPSYSNICITYVVFIYSSGLDVFFKDAFFIVS
jgi:tryptophan synthase alpha subunit